MSAKTMATSGQWTIPSDVGQRLQRGGIEEPRAMPRVKPEAQSYAKASVDGSIALVFQQFPQAPKRPLSERRGEPKDFERINAEKLKKLQREKKQEGTGRRTAPLKAVHPAPDVLDGEPAPRAQVRHRTDGERRSRTHAGRHEERPHSCATCGQAVPREYRRPPTAVPQLEIAGSDDRGRHHVARREASIPKDGRSRPAAARVRSSSVERRPSTSIDGGGGRGGAAAARGDGRQPRPATAGDAKWRQGSSESYKEPQAPRRRPSTGGRRSSSRDFVAENVQRMADQPRMQRSGSVGQLNVTGTSKKPTETFHRKGEVPDYLRRQQKKWQREEQERIARRPDPNCPQGHVVMPEKERQETLLKLENSHDKLSLELQAMPVRNDTLRIKNRKTELERSLEELEQALRIFSRPKVYVRKDTT